MRILLEHPFTLPVGRQAAWLWITSVELTVTGNWAGIGSNFYCTHSNLHLQNCINYLVCIIYVLDLVNIFYYTYYISTSVYNRVVMLNTWEARSTFLVLTNEFIYLEVYNV